MSPAETDGLAVLAQRVAEVSRRLDRQDGDFTSFRKHIDDRFDRLEFVRSETFVREVNHLREMHVAQTVALTERLDSVARVAWWCLALVITFAVGTLGSALLQASR